MRNARPTEAGTSAPDKRDSITADSGELRRALEEFATVTGCGWAGRMLAGLRAWGESTGEGDRIAALERQNAALKATVKRLSRLADAATRQLPPEARAKLYAESHET